jgi:hypothetical protein
LPLKNQIIELLSGETGIAVLEFIDLEVLRELLGAVRAERSLALNGQENDSIIEKVLNFEGALVCAHRPIRAILADQR